MGKREAIVLAASVVAFATCGWSLWGPKRTALFGSEAIRLRLRFPHRLVLIGSAFASLSVVLARAWLTASVNNPSVEVRDSNFLSLATVLVLFMLFGFVAFEAGSVSSGYRNESAEKNLLVIVSSLAAYIFVGRHIFDSFNSAAPSPNVLYTWIVFQAGFACTVSLIIANALTERASRPTNVLCAVFAAGLGYPLVAGMVWGDLGLLQKIGFVDASGASAVHLLGAAASLTAVAAVGPRVRLQRWQFLGGPETPNFRSPWSIVGGLFLMFGWMGFNSGNASPDLHGHAFFNTMVGACCGALAVWLLPQAFDALYRLTNSFGSAESRLINRMARFTGSQDRPRIVIGMMGGLVSVTANGYLSEVHSWMAVIESLLGGVVAVSVFRFMSARSRSGQIDDPLGVVATHGCAALVGLLATPFWLASAGKPFWTHLVAQLVGCGVCVVVGWLVTMLPCLLILSVERYALVRKKASWLGAKFRLRLGAIQQLGTAFEMPQDVVWKYRVEEAARRIIKDDAPENISWWEAVKTYATAADAMDKESQEHIARLIVDKLPEAAAHPEREKVALVALSSSKEYKPKDISLALDKCLSLAKGNGNGHARAGASVGAKLARKALHAWSVALLTERAAALNEAGVPGVLPHVKRGLDYLRGVTNSDENYIVQDIARVGAIDVRARMIGSQPGLAPQNNSGWFDDEGRWTVIYDLVANETALAMLLFVADRRSATITETAEEFNGTPEEVIVTAELLASHGLISNDSQELTISADGLQLADQIQHSVDSHEHIQT